MVCPGIQLDWNRTDGARGHARQGRRLVELPVRPGPAHLGLHPLHAVGHCGVHDAVRADQVRRRAAEDRLPGLRPLAKEGVLNDIDVHLVVPTPRIFGIPAIADNLDKVIADYGINLHTNSEVTSVDAHGRKVAVSERRRGRHRRHAALRRAPRRPASVGTGLDQVEPAVDRRRERVRRHRQAHDAARALPEHLQPRRRRVVTELQDRRRDPQTGPRSSSTTSTRS